MEDTTTGIPKITTIADNVPIGNLLIGKRKYGNYSWTISSTQAPGIRYKIAVQSKSNPAINDGSDNYFKITSPDMITVASPNGGNTWYKGTKPTITWTSKGNVGSYVKIELAEGWFTAPDHIGQYTKRWHLRQSGVFLLECQTWHGLSNPDH